MIELIVAVDSKRGIAANGTIPWKLPADLKFFAQKTTMTYDDTKRNAVIMGRKTWDTLPVKPLPDRLNIIVSSTLTYDHPDVIVVASLPNAFEKATDCERAFVIGGESIYTQALSMNVVSTIYLTQLVSDFGCDQFMPPFVSREDKVIKTLSNDAVIIKHIMWRSGEQLYLNLLRSILNGEKRMTRNAPTRAIFGSQLSFDLQDGFPLLTTKKMFWKGIVEELLFFLRGETNSNLLTAKGVKIWTHNTTREFLDSRKLQYETGDLGPMYGFNWRHFGAEYTGMNSDYSGKGFDQLRDVITKLISNPTDRRIMMTTYDPSAVEKSVLAPCHGIITQFYVRDNFLDCKMYQRSVDTALGFPFNIASYALLVHILCTCTGLIPGVLTMTLGDTHIYEAHVEKIKEQLIRSPKRLPEVVVSGEKLDTNDAITWIEQLKISDIELIGYDPYPAIAMDMIA